MADSKLTSAFSSSVASTDASRCNCEHADDGGVDESFKAARAAVRSTPVAAGVFPNTQKTK